MGDQPSRATVSTALNRVIDIFMGHDYDEDQHKRLVELIDQLDGIASQGVVRTARDRRDRFIGQMVDVVNEANLDQPEGFVPFAESPYSGTENPLAPTISVHRSGEAVVATVHLGLALEGAPGRAHGGAVAAVFDDIMGAVQRITGRTAYTKTLVVHYIAAFPADRDVTITAREIECDELSYTIEAEATAEGKSVARSSATFTRIDASNFGSRAGNDRQAPAD